MIVISNKESGVRGAEGFSYRRKYHLVNYVYGSCLRHYLNSKSAVRKLNKRTIWKYMERTYSNVKNIRDCCKSTISLNDKKVNDNNRMKYTYKLDFLQK